MGTSIWLLPSFNSEEYTELKEIISAASAKYASPSFDPHITFASVPADFDINALDSAIRDITGKLLDTVVEATCVKLGNTFYQSVFLAISPIDSTKLAKMRDDLCAALGIESRPMPEFAHHSLYYGENEEQKAELLAHLRRTHGGAVTDTNEVPFVFNVSGRGEFKIGSIWIVGAGESVEDWKVLRKYTV